MAATMLCVAFLSAHFAVGTPEDGFLAPAKWSPARASEYAETNVSLFDEVVPHLRTGARFWLQASLPSFVTLVEPMYTTTPKNEFGRLGHAAIRYTLNRLFVQKHGWFVNGLYAAHGSTALNTTSVTDALLMYVPLDARHAFERRISSFGLNVSEVAFLGATIEDVIGEDAVQEFVRVCQLLKVDVNDLSAEELDWSLKTHVALRITGRNKDLDAGALKYPIRHLDAIVRGMHPRWPSTVKFLRELREDVAPGRQRFDISAASQVVRDIEGRWARWSALDECRTLSHKLLEIEEGSNTGCVRLSDFYKRSRNAIDGWQFNENPTYLRKLGALDESDPSNPRLLVANYMNSYGNCVPSSKFYMACCISQCESLQLRIETALRTPDALPEDIATVVASAMSTSTPQQSTLSASLLARLQAIADTNDGRVPLHGRLFAQWMHFANPRECPFPHVAGSTSPEEVDVNGGGQLADEELKQLIIDAGAGQSPSDASESCMRWHHEEEIFVPTTKHSATTSLAMLEEDASVWNSVFLIGVAAFAALVWALTMLRMWSRSPAAPVLV